MQELCQKASGFVLCSMHAEDGEEKDSFGKVSGKFCTIKSDIRISHLDSEGVPPHNRGLQLGLQFHQEWDKLTNPRTASTASNKPESLDSIQGMTI